MTFGTSLVAGLGITHGRCATTDISKQLDQHSAVRPCPYVRRLRPFGSAARERPWRTGKRLFAINGAKH